MSSKSRKELNKRLDSLVLGMARECLTHKTKGRGNMDHLMKTSPSHKKRRILGR
jgi:hypothetical protein